MSVLLLQCGSLFSVPVTTSCHPLKDMALFSWMTFPRTTTRAAIGLASLSSAVSGQVVWAALPPVYLPVCHPSPDVEIVGAGCMGRYREGVPAGSGPVAKRGLSSLAGGAGKSEQPAPAGG